MTETDKLHLFELDRKLTMTNIHLVNMTEKDWVWPKIKISVKFTKRTFVIVSFLSRSQISVIFIRSSWFSQVNNPLFIQYSAFIRQYLTTYTLVIFLAISHCSYRLPFNRLQNEPVCRFSRPIFLAALAHINSSSCGHAWPSLLGTSVGMSKY